jgi:hypothetical protein
MSNFHKAERRKSKLRLAIAGPAGSGKTYSALQIAFGIGGKIALIDTERGSAELYSHLGEFDVCQIEAPFEPSKYVAAIKEAEKLGYDIIITDSLSHAWSGTGGLLDTHGKIADRGGNSWTAWRKITPQHNELVEALLQSTSHIIATMRSKMEYAQSEDGGKKTVKKIGLAPVQREGMEYEFTVFFDIDINHVSTASKDRTSLFDNKYFTPSTETGITLINWLNNAPDALQAPKPAPANKETKQADKVNPEPSGQTVKDNKQTDNPKVTRGSSNRFADLLAVANALKFSDENYKYYCYQRYGLHSMMELTDGQIEEQIKLLSSLKKPERLTAFRDILKGIENERLAGQIARNAATANQVPANIAHTVQ